MIAVKLADVDAIKHTIEINVCFSKIIGYHVLDFFLYVQLFVKKKMETQKKSKTDVDDNI